MTIQHIILWIEHYTIKFVHKTEARETYWSGVVVNKSISFQWLFKVLSIIFPENSICSPPTPNKKLYSRKLQQNFAQGHILNPLNKKNISEPLFKLYKSKNFLGFKVQRKPCSTSQYSKNFFSYGIFKETGQIRLFHISDLLLELHT